MIVLDTVVAVDILRSHPPAVSWLQGLDSTTGGWAHNARTAAPECSIIGVVMN
jgi:hypothetical protein